MPYVLVDDVIKVYRESDVETVALRGASLSVERGEFVAIVGRSGSGKSTLLNIMGGLAEPTAGRVSVAGVDLGRADEETRAALRRKHVGIVFQNDNLVPFLTAEENVALPLELAGRAGARSRARQLLAGLGVGDTEVVISPVAVRLMYQVVVEGQYVAHQVCLKVLHVLLPAFAAQKLLPC